MPTTETLLPGLIALGAAAAFGTSGVASKRGLAHVEALTGTLVSVGACLAVYVLAAPLWMRAEDWFTVGFWIFALTGIMQPALSMYFANEAYSRAGATVGSTFAGTTPLFAAAVAIGFLDERLTLALAAGTVLTVAGITALAWLPAPGGVGAMAGRSGIAAVLVFATLTAAIRGINQVIGKVGIDLLPNPFMAGFCSFGVSFVLLGVAYRWRRGRWPGKLPRPGLVWFCITGLCVALGAGLLYTALLVGTVTVVAPIVATFPVFTLLVAAALGDERITGKVLAGVVLVVVGVAVVSGSAG